VIQRDATNALSPLIGEPLSDIGRAVDLALVCFGRYVDVPDYDGFAQPVPEYALYLQCPFRLAGDGEVLLASQDMYYPGDDPLGNRERFRCDVAGATWFDARAFALRPFLQSRMPTVARVDVDMFGGIRLELSHGLLLEAFPVTSFPHEEWRFFKHRSNVPHFVVFDVGE